MVVAIVVFSLVARLAIYLLPHGSIRKAIVIIDDIVLIGLVGWFAWELFVYLWNRRERVGSAPAAHSAIAAGFSIAKAYLPQSCGKPLTAVARILTAIVAVVA